VCRVNLSEQACIMRFPPMRRLISWSSQLELYCKRGLRMPKSLVASVKQWHWHSIIAQFPCSTWWFGIQVDLQQKVSLVFS